MHQFVFTEFSYIYGGGIQDKIPAFMSHILNALVTLFDSNGAVNQAMEVFLGIGGLLAVIFYFGELWDLSSKDLLNLEKMVLSFMKYMAVFMLLILSPELITGTFNVCKSAYELSNESFKKVKIDNSKFKIEFFGQKEFPDSYTAVLKDPVDEETKTILKDSESLLDKLFGKDDKKAEVTMQDIFEAKGFYPGNPMSRNMRCLGAATAMFFPFIICIASIGAGYIVCITNALQLIGYGVLAPISIAQCYGDLKSSTGFTYLKKFAATGITFACIIAIIYAGHWLQNSMLAWTAAENPEYIVKNVLSINAGNFYDIVFNFKLMLSYTIVQFGTVGAILKCNQMANDVLGAR